MRMHANTKHLLLRSGFGPVPTDPDRVEVSALFQQVRKPRPLAVVDRIQPDRPDDERVRKEMFQQARKQILTLNGTWMSQLAMPDTRLREKMTLFWHDHFACRVRAPFLAQQNNNLLREFALGSFRTLLMSVSKDPAMLQFLNNQQNKKDKPNENFARELMELFTMGRGNYTEHDIKEAARAFTGWAFSPLTGDFVFREKAHDSGTKKFLGKQGHFTGEDIIGMILERRVTATFVTEKIYRYFVDATPDREVIETLAKRFFDSDYSIEVLMKELFSTSAFYDDRHRGNRIKSPVELLAGIIAQTGGAFENPDAPLFIQRALGQVLFFPPNVGGWPTGTAWIDSSSLTFRLSLPAVLLGNAEVAIEAKDDGDINNVTNTTDTRRLSMRVDWSLLAKKFHGHSAEETLHRIEDYLLARPTRDDNRKLMREFTHSAADESDFVRRAFIGYMSLPEYQMS
ncbi:MAG TPA: DUF1800 domain-containing protein [Chryseolinea sp.]|nr:DUF1800 domain-containing protein [Chryseolinea sp.]